jgi:P27 family predicted phage terminase small subunit
MGERGPAKQSKATLKLHGTFREDRHGSGELPPSEPDCPEWLSEEAKAEWGRIVPTLVQLVGVHKIDRALLATYCETWADYHRVVLELREEGETYESMTQNGTIIRLHPMVQIRNASRDGLTKLGSKLGLSPSARTGLNIGKPTDTNEDNKRKFLG